MGTSIASSAISNTYYKLKYIVGASNLVNPCKREQCEAYIRKDKKGLVI